MRFSTITVFVAVSLSTANAFVAPHRVRAQSLQHQRNTVLASLAEPSASSSAEQNRPSGRTKDEIALELASGKLMEGGQVIDFSSIKGESRAETALAKAREVVIAARTSSVNGETTANGENAQLQILGINDDVISEVGHDLGTFADAETVQKVATYLRSMAPSGFFDASEVATQQSSFTDEEKATIQDILRKAYDESGEVTSAFAKTFYMGTQLLPVEAREAIWAIYVWCRRTDEIVDAPRENDDEMLSDLSSWEIRLESLWKHGAVEDVFDLCLLDVRIKYPDLEIIPFVDMVRGMLMDVPDLGQDRYETFDELHLYCYRVAGTVGLMSMPIFGCAPGYDADIAREPALSLGVAFQITNILRDVGEDAAERGRIYLPRQDMERFGVTEEQVMAQRMDENYAAFMKFQIERARKYYDSARRGVFMLSEESRLPVQSSLDAYGLILSKIEENNYDSLSTRAYTTKWEKLLIIPFSWYRTLEISKTLPLFGDRPFVDQELP